ncbi:MFS transporter [Nakamurella sp. YIM 132087]|uniref:MFS transporter n=1 Tax=Nakamurella alba TaxID=2665158 RepID=A0A7K1FNN3_9ACTN|nr:MFS transporter [Nakamurella alba]MTD15690.1 MFS transporter [Nakamurella alba]
MPDVPERSPAGARRIPLGLMLVAVIALALNLRLSVNSVGAVLPLIRSDLGLDGLAGGALNALPPVVFAFAGIVTPWVAGRIGAHRLVLVAIVASLAGQLFRVLVPGATALFAGTGVSLIGLAAGNVLMPGLIRRHFPEHITTVTAVYVTTLSLGATIGSGVTIPLQNGLGGDWRTGLLVWALVAVTALVPWLLVVLRSRGSERAGRGAAVPLRALLRTGLGWAMAGFFALQTVQIYIALGWLGQVLLDAGVPPVTMGALLAIPPALSIALSLAVPLLLRTQSRIRPVMMVFGICYAGGYLGMLLAPADAAWLWMLLVGIGGGTFALGLTMVPLRARTPDGTVALSAFTQCLGYLLGAIGPLVFGALHDLTGDWTVPLVVAIVSLVPMVLVGVRLTRDRAIEDEIPGPSMQ